MRHHLNFAWRLSYVIWNSNRWVPHAERVALERAFNIVGHPELRACYDSLLADAEAPALFPYGGFGSLLRGRRAFPRWKDLLWPPHRGVFSGSRIAGDSTSHCGNVSSTTTGHCAAMRVANLSFWLDPVALQTHWHRTWNQWKHLLGSKIEVEGTFVRSGKYRKRHDEWDLVTWETALPSRLNVKLPSDFPQQVEAAKATHHRFGQYSQALDQMRLLLQHRAVEKAELAQICSRLHLPGDFDVAQIGWRADYDPFFYRQLGRRARRIYLFRDEYIFDIEKAVVVETPQLGHATYVFAKPRSMDSFLALYTRITKDDVRQNRDNAAERLGFLGRVIHGTNPRAWLKEVRTRIR